MNGNNEQIGGLLSRMANNGTMMVQQLGKIIEALASSAVFDVSGSFTSSSIPVGSAVALTTATTANITSLTLTTGEWEIWGNVAFDPDAGTTVAALSAALSTTSATLPTKPGDGAYAALALTFTTGADQLLPTGTMRLSVTGSTTVYLVAQATFGVSTMAAYGFIGARRWG